MTRDSRFQKDTEYLIQSSLKRDAPDFSQFLSLFSQPDHISPLFLSLLDEEKHSVGELKEVNSSLHNSSEQEQSSVIESPQPTSYFARWFYPLRNRSLASAYKVAGRHLLSMGRKDGQNRIWNQSAAGSVSTLKPRSPLNSLWDPDSLRVVLHNPLAYFKEKEIGSSDDLSQNSPQDKNSESDRNLQSTNSSVSQGFQKFTQKDHRQLYSIARNQPSPDTSVIQQLLSFIQTYANDNKPKEYLFQMTDTSAETLRQSSPSDFDIHSEVHLQPESQKPLEIPSNLVNVLDLFYDVDLSNEENEIESISSALAPATPQKVTSFYTDQPFIPAYHQASGSSAVQDSLSSDFPLNLSSSASLLSSVDPNSTSCLKDTLCTMGVAIILALGVSTLVLLSFSPGRRKRSLDDETHHNENMMKILVSGLLQGPQMEQCLPVTIHSGRLPENDTKLLTKNKKYVCVLHGQRKKITHYYRHKVGKNAI